MTAAYEAMTDLVFHTANDTDLLLDLYLPTSGRTDPTPVVVYIFGGAWRVGDRHQVLKQPWLCLTGHGLAVASITYRLSDQALFPAQIHDVKYALAWLRRHAPQYRLDPDRIAVLGPSAGGHLAALAGTTSATDGLLPDGLTANDCRVRAVVDLFGPTDFLQMDSHSISSELDHDAPDSPESQLIGTAIQSRPDLVARANPITYVDGDEPPMLLIHGASDPLVPHHQSELLNGALRDGGSICDFMTVKGGHGGAAFETDEVVQRVVDFLDQHLTAAIGR
jgi:acetyl esterase/lipase